MSDKAIFIEYLRAFIATLSQNVQCTPIGETLEAARAQVAILRGDAEAAKQLARQVYELVYANIDDDIFADDIEDFSGEIEIV